MGFMRSMPAVLITFLLLLNVAGAQAETQQPPEQLTEQPSESQPAAQPSAEQTPAESQSNAQSTEQVDALIAVSGLRQQIDQIPLAIGSAGQQQAGMAAVFVQPLISALQDAFKPDELITTLRVDLMRQLDSTTLADSLRWYNSDAAKTILAAEQRLAQPEVMENIGRAISQQQWPGLTPDRRKRLQELDSATGATDTALDLMQNLQAAFLSGFSQLITPDQQSTFNSLRQSFATNREEYRVAVNEQLLLQQAVLLEPVPDATLQEFAGFATSPSGQKLFAALRRSLDHTVQIAAQKIPQAVQQVSDALRAEVKTLPGDAATAPTQQPQTEVTPVAPISP
ncbi:MAG TPA: hypothetical protein VM553_05860 [Dongiaceae bacterium]|nr:hypothetical protein [Dongiaceae bacterium]